MRKLLAIGLLLAASCMDDALAHGDWKRAVRSFFNTNTADSSGACTYTSVAGMSTAVQSGVTYGFRAWIPYTSAATTTGSAWSVTGPSMTTLVYSSRYSLTTTTETVNHGLTAADNPAACNATSAATGSNTAEVWGTFTPSAGGLFGIRMATEVDTSAITAIPGGILEVW